MTKLPNDIRLVAETPEQTYVFVDGEPAQVTDLEVQITLVLADGMTFILTSKGFTGELNIQPEWSNAHSRVRQ